MPRTGAHEDALEFQLLGPLRLVRSGTITSIGSPKQRVLLAALVVGAGQVLSTDRLCDMIWGDAVPREPERSLHTHISRLRTVLADAGGEPASDLLVTEAPGYVLRTHPDSIDARKFERLLGEAQRATDPRSARDRLDDALALWRGAALAEFEQDFARAEARRLEELRLVAIEERIDAILALGGHAHAVGELDRLVTEHPLRERLRAQWMTALYRCGRQADALAGYRRFRDHLDAELGLRPSEPLRRLERDILQQADHVGWQAAAPPGRARSAGGPGGPPEPASSSDESATVQHQLPAELTSFVGRQQEAAGLAAALPDTRLVTLTGPGGVGKTRLAVRAARHAATSFPDGVRFCDLATVSDAAAVAPAVATALGARVRSGHSPQDAVADLLRGKQVLMLVDNCEHVVEAAAALTTYLMQACPELRLLVTSRRPLTIAGERLWPVEPLPITSGFRPHDPAALPPATRLFYDRARARRPDLRPGPDTLPAVTEICRRLDGLPLAIELAAARSRSLTPADIATRLEDRFALLTGGDRTASDRHRTLRAVVDWSYDLLDPAAGTLLDRLSVFAGSFSLTSVEQVCHSEQTPEHRVADLVGELVDHSLLVADQRGTHVRYRLLETLRQYGRQRLDDRGETATWQRRHASHFTALAEELVPRCRGADQAAAVRQLDQELANLREALRFCLQDGELDLAVRLTVSQYDYAMVRLHDEIFRWAEQVHDVDGTEAHPRFAQLCGVAAMGCSIRGELDRAERFARRGLAAAPEPGDPRRKRPLGVLADVALYRGDLEQVELAEDEELRIARDADDSYTQALCHLRLALASLYTGARDRALTHVTQLGVFAEACGSPTALGWHRYARGELLRTTDPDEAATSFEEAIELVEPLGDRFVPGVARVSLASLAATRGEFDRALRSFRDVVAHWRDVGDWTHQWTTLRNLVTLFARIGACEPAAVLRAAVLAAQTGAPVYGEDADRMATLASALKADLGPSAFRAMDARGAALSDAEAVDHALAQIDRLLVDAPGDVESDATGAPRG